MFKDEKELKANGPKECVHQICSHYWDHQSSFIQAGRQAGRHVIPYIHSPFSNIISLTYENQLVMPIDFDIVGQTNRIESLTNELKIHVGTRQIMGFPTSV